ncbi:alpha/beta hydrolase [Pseudomonas fluorescens]|uniref:alpha/beta fold hydrolase n=1 Tax=Pseudomonas fluorescens TaxID=294 RepID=UPI0019047768|nr:alpha/beta hydrolase [Pseudomonas fluorescens]MBD8716917.1 alpha/beta hydrolase [Pseudomonas fluorescens]
MNRRPDNTYVLVAGAWHGAWVWRDVIPVLRGMGHAVSAPTLSGLGERRHTADACVGLGTHIEDVVAHIVMEDLHAVTLVGWSYGGMVTTGVAARLPGRIQSLIYLDAFVPEPGKARHWWITCPPSAAQGWRRLRTMTCRSRPTRLRCSVLPTRPWWLTSPRAWRRSPGEPSSNRCMPRRRRRTFRPAMCIAKATWAVASGSFTTASKMTRTCARRCWAAGITACCSTLWPPSKCS